MDRYRLDDMIRGWFVGDFSPSVVKTADFEVAVQRYKAGDVESEHVHKIATEITVIVDGQAKMNGVTFNKGDILRIPPGDFNQFEAITDVTTVVVKFPSVPNDKYLRGDQ